MELNTLSGTALIKMISNGTVSSKEVMVSVLQRIEEVESSVCAFLTLTEPEKLLRAAEAVDDRRQRGEKVGVLAGLPVAVKDNLCTSDLRTTCASRMLEMYRPPYDATVIQKVRDADGIVIGKTNMDEFSMGSSTETSAFKVTRNPHNLAFVPGGTSGGSAAAVAANETVFALGSDTGGSIRQPASFCGVLGLKPTYGSVSRSGLVAYASSLDVIGPITKTSADARLLFSVISGHDPKDSTTVGANCIQSASISGSTLRIGLPTEYFVDGVDQAILGCRDKMSDTLAKLGHQLVDIHLPHTKYAVPAYYVIASAEMSSNLERYDGCRYGHRTSEYRNLREMMSRSRSEGLGEEVRRRLMLGTFVLSAGYYDAYYDKALRVRSLIARDFVEAFTTCDLIMAPVAPTPAFRIGEKITDPISMYLGDIFSVTANLAGIPAVSVPFGATAEGLPLSMQFLASWGKEELLFHVADALLDSMEGVEL
jgi:aspartyl-tRNA(Asn)/glutamyl-tRNA(Gln) amidotransferase subunit A